MKSYTVAVLGATGAVGKEMIRILQERNFPVGTLLPLSSARSAGSAVNFRGQRIPVQEATDRIFSGVDIVLGATDQETARRFAPAIVEAGAVLIDNSSAFRLDPEVPLVVPEINGEDVKNHSGIIANPNCTTAITLMAVAPLSCLAPIVSIQAATYQAVSGAGAAGPIELMQQVLSLAQGQSYAPQVFPFPIAFNLIPQISGEQEQGYTAEEMKLQYEGRKILHQPALAASCTCVRVPVVRCHSIAASVGFAEPVSVENARRVLGDAPGCLLVDDLPAGKYPMPLTASDQDLVQVGRIRPDLTDPNKLCLWCCGDQLRKGAATNAVQIAQLLLDSFPENT